MPLFRLFCALLLLTFAAGCRDYHEWAQKMTVTVITPAGEVTGTSVMRVKARFERFPMGGNEVFYSYDGESPVVEVLPGRFLVVTTLATQELFYWSDRERFKGLDRKEWLFEIPKQTVPVTVWPQNKSARWLPNPFMITYRDAEDVDTIEPVDPTDLAASFGEGVSLKSVTLAITDEPATQGQLARTLPCARDGKHCYPCDINGQYCWRKTIETPKGKLSDFKFWGYDR